MNRWALFWVSLAASLLLTIGFRQLGFGGFFAFLFLPFLFWPRSGSKTCPQCGHGTMHPAERYCPIDGDRLIRK